MTPISRLPHKKGVENAVKTESTNFKSMEDRLSKVGLKRLLHAGMGLSTEAGEFLDALKKTYLLWQRTRSSKSGGRDGRCFLVLCHCGLRAWY